MSGLWKIVVIAGALALAPALSSAKPQTWVEVRSPNFIVVSNAGEKSARKAALQFEQIRAVFRQSLQGVSQRPSPVVTILAAKDENSLRDLLPEYWAKGRAHPAGLFVTNLNHYFAAVTLDAQGSSPYETFYHEYYHAITIPYFPDLPVWLSEGLAEFYGHTEIDEKTVGLGHIDGDLLQLLREETLIPLDVLFKVDQSSPYYNEANKTSLFYAESWALTHYLMMANRPLFTSYLSALGQGKKGDEATAASFGDVKKLQSDLKSYIRGGSFQYLRGAAPARLAEDQLQARTLTEAEAGAYRGGFAVTRGRAEDAIGILQQALQLDPKLALTNEYMGMAQLMQGQREKALESESQAIALDPKNAFTRYLRAFLLTVGGGMVSNDSRIEEDLRQAIAISPDFAPPYGLLAVYLSAIGRDLPEALSFAQRGVALEPGASGPQLSLAQVLARMNRFDEAEIALVRANAWARDPAQKANAESFHTYLEQMRQYRKLTEDEEKIAQKVISQPEALQADDNSKSATPNAPPPVGLQMQASISVLGYAGSFNLTPYLKQITHAVLGNVSSQLEGVAPPKVRNVAVEFSILRNGAISGLKQVLSSGDDRLDHMTWDAVAKSSPLPALPTAFKGQSLRLHLGLSYSPESQ